MRPSTKTCRPLDRYFEQTSARLPHTTMRCHSVRSCRCPFLSFQLSLVATRSSQTPCPLGVYRMSGSAPRLPTRMTLLTPPAMTFPLRSETTPPRLVFSERQPFRRPDIPPAPDNSEVRYNLADVSRR